MNQKFGALKGVRMVRDSDRLRKLKQQDRPRVVHPLGGVDKFEPVSGCCDVDH